MNETVRSLLGEILASLEASPADIDVSVIGGGSLRSVFAVSDLATASIAAAGIVAARLCAPEAGHPKRSVTVDRDLADAWFSYSIRPEGWSPPPPWDPIAGDYEALDGWIRLHTNAPHHRAAALHVLGAPGERDAVAQAVSRWSTQALETAVVEAGGAAAAMRSRHAWDEHAQGRAVAIEPLVAFTRTQALTPGSLLSFGAPGRPLAGLRVLDLTRVLAGPAATRLLGGWGAEVLRIDPLDWQEPAVEVEMTLGKRCARLDLRSPHGRSHLLSLLASADVLVHGYRPGALERLGLGPEALQRTRPGLIDVSLSAYGWSGPWWDRRGFDSLVQMSAGIAAAGRALSDSDAPAPLPVQALDHATGYIMAAAALSGLRLRQTEGVGSRWRTSLARTAQLLIGAGSRLPDGSPPASATGPSASGEVELTTWGPARRIAPPLLVGGAPLHWSLPARALGTDQPRWNQP